MRCIIHANKLNLSVCERDLVILLYVNEAVCPILQRFERDLVGQAEERNSHCIQISWLFILQGIS